MVPHSLLREACLQRLLPSGDCAWESYSLHSEDRWKRLKNDAHRNIETIRNGQTSLRLVSFMRFAKENQAGLWGVEYWLILAESSLSRGRVCSSADSAPVDLSPKDMKVKLEEGRKLGSWFSGQFWDLAILVACFAFLKYSYNHVSHESDSSLKSAISFQNILVESCGIWCFK